MSKMIQVRNVPDDLHTELKVRAARAGMSLSDFLLKELAVIARTPPLEDVFERIHRSGPVETSESAADAVRAHRDA
jgi:hypothetical protein